MTQDEQTNLDNRLRDAAADGHTETVRALLAAGADVHAHEDMALLNAASCGHTKTVEVLLAHGADVHRDEYVLCVAASNGHTETVKALLAAGANVDAMDDLALCVAARYGHTDTVKVLLSASADVHAENDYALRWAAYWADAKTVRFLARHIFAPESWRGKSRAEIEEHASALYDKLKAGNPPPDRLHKVGTILADCAIDCWHQVRPPPPPGFKISPLPAQPRPL
jgi:ankyrin repeat protein